MEATLATIRRILIDKIEQLNARLESQENREQLAKDSISKRSHTQSKQRITFALSELTGHLLDIDNKASHETANNEMLARSRGELECPICYDQLDQEVWQCGVGHLICGKCQGRSEVKKCPTCRGAFMGRAHAVERLAKILFNQQPR